MFTSFDQISSAILYTDCLFSHIFVQICLGVAWWRFNKVLSSVIVLLNSQLLSNDLILVLEEIVVDHSLHFEK